MSSNVLTWLRRIFLATVALVVIVFSVANRGEITFSFSPVPYEIAMPKVLFALVCFIFGALFGAAFLGVRNVCLKASLKRSENKCSALEQEVAGLRADAARHLPEVPKLPSLQ